MQHRENEQRCSVYGAGTYVPLLAAPLLWGASTSTPGLLGIRRQLSRGLTPKQLKMPAAQREVILVPALVRSLASTLRSGRSPLPAAALAAALRELARLDPGALRGKDRRIEQIEVRLSA